MTLAAHSDISAGLGFIPLHSVGPGLLWIIIAAVIFAECAFIVGLFLPGDSLLLTVGVVLAQNPYHAILHVWGLSIATALAAIAGNQLGYRIGQRTGTRLLARRGGRVLNHRNLERARHFFERWGFWAIVLSRWIPWIRTLAPPLAGAANMDKRRYFIASVIGAVGWVPTIILIGYHGANLLDEIPWIKTTTLIIMVAFVASSAAYGLWRYCQEIRRPVDCNSKD